MRFNIRIDAVWQALLLLGGATAQNSYVILGDDGMHFRLGLLFNRTIPYDRVAAVFPRSWPFLYGIGARTNFRGVLRLTGSFHDVVEVRLKKRTGNWAAVFPVDRIAVSLEEPELFIEELSRRTGLAEPPDINALSRPTRRPTKAKPTADRRQPSAEAPAAKSATKPAPAGSNDRGKAAPAKPKSQASAPPKAAAPQRAARKAAPSRTAARARRSTLRT